MAPFSDDPWSVVASGPQADEADCLLRWTHHELPTRGTRSGGNLPAANLSSGEAGEYDIADDGELLIAHRVDEPMARRWIGRPPARAKQIGVEAPELSAAKWINTDQSLSLADLRGKVVLLAFFNSGDERSLGALPALDKLSAKYGDKGLVVLGVDSSNDTAQALDGLKLKLPIMADDGETTKRYAVNVLPMPIYFSIRRDGILTFVHSSAPPPAWQLERLLDRDD
jgi:thiol-disulfide isomerase/thioredoxin